MRWNTIVPTCLVAPVTADPEVQAVLGDPVAFFMAGEREFKVNSMRWTLITPGIEDELWERTLVQIDFWVRSMDSLVALSRALRRLLHHDVEIEVGGLRLWSQLVGGRPLPGAKDGVHAHALDFRLTYLREKYA